CFFRYVGVVYQQELRKPDIGPEDRECEHKFTEVMQVIAINNLQVSCAFQRGNDQGNHGKACYPPACKTIPAIHSTEPVTVNAHHPIPCCDRRTYSEEYQEYR